MTEKNIVCMTCGQFDYGQKAPKFKGQYPCKDCGLPLFVSQNYIRDEQRLHLYSMGQVEPIIKDYLQNKNTYCGSDIKLFLTFGKFVGIPKLVGPEPTSDDPWQDSRRVVIPQDASIKCAPNNLQAISYAVKEKQGILGTLIFLMLNGESMYKDLRNKQFQMHLIASNEYSRMSAMSLIDAKIIDYSLGMSVDDVVFEEQMTFKAKKIVPWTRLK